MIYVGVTGWGDHDIYPKGISSRNKLNEYAGHFPTVEVDAFFYAIQPARNVEKWVKDTPADFRFVVKAYQGMTGHERGEIPFASREEMFNAYIESIEPFAESGKLAMILFQFPPWFKCSKENVDYLRMCRQRLERFPAAAEFRNQTWFSPRFYEKTLHFLKNEGWIHVVCDEPQVGEASVPIVLAATDKDKALVRMHGRNTAAWMKPGGKNWRETRYLYRYNREELELWKEHILRLQAETKDVFVLFNNNSGGDAAGNAKTLIDLLGIQYKGLAARQLDLF